MLKEATRTTDLPRGYRGTDKTIRLMHDLVQKAKLDPTMHRIATWIRLSVPNDRKGSTRETAQAIFDWVKRHGVFQRDQFQIERVEHPVSSMQSIVKARKKGVYSGPGLFVGDCDQFAIWVAALGGILGFQYAFETAKTDLRRPDEFSHVWTSLLLGKEWLPLDASTHGAFPGWRPPVGKDRLKLWPERAVGGSMSGTNGRAKKPYYGLSNGDSLPSTRRAWQGNLVPQDYFGWGVPKDFDFAEEEPVLRDSDPSRLDMLIPAEPSIPRAELRDDAGLPAKKRVPPPHHRPSLTQGDEEFNTGPRYAPPGPHPYYKIRGQFYPPGSKFNRVMVSDYDRSSVKRGTRYRVAPATAPVADVDVVMGQPFAVEEKKKGKPMLRRRSGEAVVLRPRRIPAGMGQGEEDEFASLEETAGSTVQKAEEAGKSVWDTISGIIDGAIDIVGDVATERVKGKYATQVANATNRVAGQNVASSSTYYRPEEEASPWYMSPWVWIGGLLVAGGTVYALTRPKGGRSRRRYRRNPIRRRA